jgi:hypothetical protein
MEVVALNALSERDFCQYIYKCCASARFADKITMHRPYGSLDQMLDRCDHVWLHDMRPADWLESFKAHPKIGDKEELRKKLAGVKSMEGDEQAGKLSLP